METQTKWPDDGPPLDETARSRIALQMHENPAAADCLEYIRTHTGFCRAITVTPADLARLGHR